LQRELDLLHRAVRQTHAFRRTGRFAMFPTFRGWAPRCARKRNRASPDARRAPGRLRRGLNPRDQRRDMDV
jgi:hypothetical protein